MFYVGDLHGGRNALMRVDHNAIKAKVENVVQCGDFGMYFANVSTDPMAEYFNTERTAGPTWYVTDGNHENHPHWLKLWEQQGYPNKVKLCNRVYWVPRGTYLEIEGVGHAFCGSATSIDKAWRVDGVSWHAEEEITYTDQTKFLEVMYKHKPEVVVTHDAPSRLGFFKDGPAYSGIPRWPDQPTPKAFEAVLRHIDHAPKDWFFGHHHHMEVHKIEGTTYRCCGLAGQYWVRNADGVSQVYKS